jgi:integrase
MKIKDEGINYEIEGIIREYRRKCNLLGLRINSMTAEQVIEYLENDRPFSLDFIKFGRENAGRLRKEGREGTARNHDVALNALAAYIKRDSLDISEITGKFLKKFVKWIEEKQPETKRAKGQRAPSLYTSIIRTIHNTAKEEYNDEDTGTVNIPFSPFAKFKVPSEPVTRKRALPIDVIQSIIDLPYDISGTAGGKWSRFNLAKDCFILSFALIGMNSADLFYAGSAEKDVITYNRRKTATRRTDKAEMRMRIEPCISALMKKYRDPDGKRLFNFYLHYGDAAGFNKAINKGLKQIGKKLGIEDLEYYAARHSWATIARSSAAEIDKHTVHEALNHSDQRMKTTDIYIDRDWSVIWNANRKVLALFDWSATL